jgi:hypothetical protein
VLSSNLHRFVNDWRTFPCVMSPSKSFGDVLQRMFLNYRGFPTGYFLQRMFYRENRDRKNMDSVAPGTRSPDLSVHGRTLFPLPLKRRYQEEARAAKAEAGGAGGCRVGVRPLPGT